MTREEAEKLVRALYSTAFYEGQLECRENPAYVTLEKADAASRAARAALIAALTAPRVPEGWQAVPKVPIVEMLEKGDPAYLWGDQLIQIWTAMLAAAPKVPT